MTDFTIEQLEALKEGTKNSPWRPEYDEGDEHWVIAFDHPKFGGRWDKGIAHGEGTAKAFAAAPALVDESIGDKRALIAEKRAHQKLRAEIEAVLDVVKHETWLHDDEGQFPETVQLGSYVTGQLTRILEADNG